MGELIKLYSKTAGHWVAAKVCLHFPSKIEDACIHLLESGVDAKKCAKILGCKDIENKADWVIDSMREELGI